MNPNDPRLKSWVEVPPESDFPIQNLPFGIFRKDGSARAGVAIGNEVVDLASIHDQGYFDTLNLPKGIFAKENLNEFLGLGKIAGRRVRERISDLLRHDNATLKDDPAHRANAIVRMNDVQMLMPVRVQNYTDFYSSEVHATNVGSMFRDPKNALLPNWKHMPVAYHGRASSIVVSGTPVQRPKGQVKSPEAEFPSYQYSSRMDFELEVAFITCAGNKLGSTISAADADDHIFGFVLFNDWSARDLQQWEYVPLGPFLGKNFASTVSPWIVTMDALEPFRIEGPEQIPKVLPYLSFEGKRHFDISLEVAIQPSGDEQVVVSRSNYKYMYWNVAQQLAHHTVNGCNIEIADLYASGTISGPSPTSFGSMLELSWNGQRPIQLSNGKQRTFLEDNDTVTMRGYAMKDGVRIGFGECSGKLLRSDNKQ